jgi:crotonobetainyl-CoA:carnitine CoA-transferase CaiB-like acyl-CoA transferase
MPSLGNKRKKSVLGNLRVVDLSMGWAGPLVAMLLADFGAQIIKIESIRHLDWWRGGVGQNPDDREYEKRANFNGVNRNKLGTTLDLNDPRCMDTVRELIGISDVLVENFTPRVMRNWGLTYDRVREINPSIVMISMPGFGSAGPWRNYAGFGNTIESLSGVAALTGWPDGPPVLQSNAYGDPVSGLGGAIGVLMALAHRLRTGEGQHMEISHQEMVIHHIAPAMMDYIMNRRVHTRIGNRNPTMAPHGVYPCSGEDQWIAIAVNSDVEWQSLCGILGHPEIAKDPRFDNLCDRQDNHDDLDDLISSKTAQWDKVELAQRLQDVGIAASPVNDAAEALADPQVMARDSFVWIDRKYIGNHPYPNVTARLSKTPGEVYKATPTLGEDNEFVLSEVLGMNPDVLVELKRDGLIGDEAYLGFR